VALSRCVAFVMEILLFLTAGLSSRESPGIREARLHPGERFVVLKEGLRVPAIMVKEERL
jgi:hypothetical protein